LTNILPVLLAGGSGTRLWPLSRKSYPKQFSRILGDETLFQRSAKRLTSSKNLQFKSPIIMTNSEFRFIVTEQLKSVGIDPGVILIEPEGRNTAPAILAATIYAIENDPDATILVTPSDHIIPDNSSLHAAISKGINETKNGRIVTFGVAPTRPEVGYGYLELSELSSESVFSLKRFVEKPDIETAKAMFNNKNYLWNAGIFMFRGKDMINAFHSNVPEMMDEVKKAIEQGKKDLHFFRLETDSWKKCENISIDYAIMEKLDTLSVVPYSSSWNDLGGWDAVWQEQGPDADGVVNGENTTAIECKNVLLRSESESLHLVGFGLENVIAIAMPDAVLVANKNRAQDIKAIVSNLKDSDVSQGETFSKDYRPWGWFEILSKSENFQVKRLHVLPRGKMSLQSHQFRSEHWIMVRGTAKVTIDDNISFLKEGESTYVPLGSIHRIENSGKTTIVLIEVQIGDYLEEDDIIRYQDIYKRT